MQCVLGNFGQIEIFQSEKIELALKAGINQNTFESNIQHNISDSAFLQADFRACRQVSGTVTHVCGPFP